MFSFKGRINRTTFLLGNLIYAIFAIPIYLIPEKSISPYEDNLLFIVGTILIATLMIWAIISLHTRRLHDLGLSGWFLPLVLIPSASFVLLLLPGKTTTQFGAKPIKSFELAKLFER